MMTVEDLLRKIFKICDTTELPILFSYGTINQLSSTNVFYCLERTLFIEFIPALLVITNSKNNFECFLKDPKMTLFDQVDP